MKHISIFALLLTLCSCSAMVPAFMSAVDDIATDEAATFTIYKSAMNPGTDAKVNLEIIQSKG